ncbi:KUP/HAK/KT family potassium transporter [Methanospirillum lacunae]|uniref:K+ potassium transporter integral membrane domain-containing protein n=1 Tax=Methanospirillum lacunae TaxID=668570 RepID=A0A2V2MYR6_9EURY|nr:KUP/HAK/KT family potassium transporter [Methanospirillum lacunae]PWR72609.1 hypothetical protein DK846_06485 [Methanospirillum lacunae]
MAYILDSSRVLKSLGLVFGDIGTSPIYTMGVILLMIFPNEENIFGVLSLIVYRLRYKQFLMFTHLMSDSPKVLRQGSLPFP